MSISLPQITGASYLKLTMLCDQITCATSSEIKRSPFVKPEYFLPGVELLQGNTMAGFTLPLWQLHILMDQNSFQGGGITCQQYFYYHPFTQLLSSKDKPMSLRTSPSNGVSGQWPKKASIFTRFLQSRCPYNVPTIWISQATLLLCTAPSGSQAQNLKHRYWETPGYPTSFTPTFSSCIEQLPPVWKKHILGHISQHGNPKQVLHLSRTACPDPAGFFEPPGSLTT